MSQLGILEAGSRHDLHVGISPDAPDEGEIGKEGSGVFGYAHSYETSSRYDGPGLRSSNRVHHPGSFRLVMSGVRCAKDE